MSIPSWIPGLISNTKLIFPSISLYLYQFHPLTASQNSIRTIWFSHSLLVYSHMGTLGSIAIAVLVLVLQHDRVHGKHAYEKLNKCDIYQGSWVYDDSYPLYDSSLCNFLEKAFKCQQNGRLDKHYLKYRWQPSSCKLPRCVFLVLAKPGRKDLNSHFGLVV